MEQESMQGIRQVMLKRRCFFMEQIQSFPLLRRRMLALLGIPMAWFFANHYLENPMGFHMALFWPVFLLLSLWFFREKISHRDITVVLSALAVLTGSIRSAVYASEEMHLLNFIILPLLSIFCILLAIRKDSRFHLMNFLQVLNVLILRPPFSLGFVLPFLSGPKVSREVRTGERRLMKEILVGILLAAPLVLLLVVLLRNADSGFASMLEAFLNGFRLDLNLEKILGRVLRTFIAFTYFIGVILGLLVTRHCRREDQILPKGQSPVISLIILWSVDVVYLVFTLVQLRTLYFPSEALTSLSQSIAQYARSGFFSLLLVLGINLFLLWLLSSITEDNARHRSALTLGYILMALFTVNMIASSFYKMHLYEMEYGYTYLRFFVKFALFFFSIGLAMAVLYLTGRLKDFLKALALSALGLYIVMNLLNLDAIIAGRAARIYAMNQRLDVAYLSELSADACSTLYDVFQLDTAYDPQLLDLKQRYRDNLMHQLRTEQFSQHPLAVTVSELRVQSLIEIP